ncbi:hypothetical protein IPG36_04620 [bacterium]|nr:MAG: hypothetical protein IPG36_04620 [bacterium]
MEAYRREIVEMARAVYEAAPRHHVLKAAEFMFAGDSSRTVAEEATLDTPNGKIRIAYSQPAERPPFEWHWEITSDMGEADFFKHYLIRENDVVLAQKRVLTPIDDFHAGIVLGDLRAALKHARPQ